MRSTCALGSYAVLIVLVVAAGVRLSYVTFAKAGPCVVTYHGRVVGEYHSECTGEGQGKANDQIYYNAAANQIARGKGFTDAFHPGVATADHPPLAAIVLAGVSFAFNHLPLSTVADSTHLTPTTVVHNHVREQRYFMALLGTFNVFLLIVLTRRFAGATVAIVAGAIAALYPYLWVNDGLLFSETVAITCVLLTLLAAWWCRERPSPWRFALGRRALRVRRARARRAARARAVARARARVVVARRRPPRRRDRGRRCRGGVRRGARAVVRVQRGALPRSGAHLHERRACARGFELRPRIPRPPARNVGDRPAVLVR